MRATLDANTSALHFAPEQHTSLRGAIEYHGRAWMIFVLAMADIIGLMTSATLAMLLREVTGVPLDGGMYLRLIPVLGIFLAVYGWRGLYPGLRLGAVEELRRLTVNTSLTFVALAAASFWMHTGHQYSRLVLIMTWAFALVIVPAGRTVVREVMPRLGVWGERVAVIGEMEAAEKLVRELKSRLKQGRKPVVAFDHCKTPLMHPCGVPVLPKEEMEVYCKQHNIRTALVIYDDLNDVEEVREAYQDLFMRVLLVSKERNTLRLSGVSVSEVSGAASLEIRQNLMDRWAQLVKRLLDIVGAGVGLLLLAPLFAVVAALIYLDNPGRIFYQQVRVGKGGRHFKLLKFRTMVMNADQVLADTLASNPAMKAEWDCYQKLAKDPRITRVGTILRRFSIDELPQLWNVLRGEMSLVGPRPFFPKQKELYGKSYNLYVKVHPGITGMWQVSGRNGTTFAERARWDEYYVRQWSIWLDIYILIRTIWVVLRHEGAY